MVWLGSIPSRAAVLFAVASVGIFIGGVAVEDKLTLQTDPVQWVNQDSQTIKDIHKVEKLTGGSSELGVFATSNDVFSDKFATFAHDFTTDTLRQYPKKLLTGSSIETAIGDIVNDVPGGSDLAPRGIDVRNAYDVAPSDVRASAVTDDGRAFNILFRTGPGSLEARAPVVRGIRADTHPPAGHPGHPVGARRRRRRAARQPRSQPDRAHLPRDPLRLPVPRRPAALRHPRRCCRWCRCSSRSGSPRWSRTPSTSSSAR